MLMVYFYVDILLILILNQMPNTKRWCVNNSQTPKEELLWIQRKNSFILKNEFKMNASGVYKTKQLKKGAKLESYL